jgi:diguanylate cyclase (GGDEF)-like protein
MTPHDSLALVLRDFARTLLTDFDIQRILDMLVERIVAVLPVTGAGVTLITADRAPRYVAASDEAALRFERLQSSLGQGPCLTAYETGQPVALADLALAERYPDFAPAAVAEGLAAVFTFPLHHGEQRLGALDLYRSSTGELDPWAWDSAQTLADVASAYLLNAEARDQAQTVADGFRTRSLHDPLTGLPNRVLLQERLEHAAHRASRTHSAAAVLFVDLDRFKRINDTYGHAAGDDLLRSVAQRLTALLRPGDTLARVSGDEFVVLCEDLASPHDAELVARRITEAFSSRFDLLTTTVAVTASVGVAYAGPGEVITGRLMAEADSAMYRPRASAGPRTTS